MGSSRCSCMFDRYYCLVILSLENFGKTFRKVQFLYMYLQKPEGLKVSKTPVPEQRLMSHHPDVIKLGTLLCTFLLMDSIFVTAQE